MVCVMGALVPCKTVEPIGMQFACRVVLLQGTILALPVKYERQRCGLEPIKLVRLSLHDTSVKSDEWLIKLGHFYLCFGMFNGI